MSGKARVMGPALSVAALVLTACGTAPDVEPSTSSTATPALAAVTVDYRPGLAAQVRVPAGEGPAPLIVMIPGGGWATADPTGLIPLANALARDGSTTSLITYRTTEAGSTFPAAVDDVACAIRWSAQEATVLGRPPARVIVLGHSAGGHLASLVTFSGDEFGSDCPAPPVTVDGLIGLAGVYDTDAYRAGLAGWMGVDPTGSPDLWERVNPRAWLDRGAEELGDVRVLLLHGDADTSVPLSETTQLAQGLVGAGVDVSTEVLPGLGHLEVFEAPNAEPPIRAWMDAWPTG